MTTPEAAPRYELPGARAVVSRGFDLIVAASGQIRQASVYIGLLVLLVAGPTIVLGSAALAAAPDDIEAFLTDIAAQAEALERGTDPNPLMAEWLSVFLMLMFLAVCVLVGVIAVSVEAQIMAVAILGGRLAGKPVRVREALVRSRQTFWRMVRAAVLVAIPVYVTQAVVAQALAGLMPNEETALGGSTLLAGFLGTLVGTPFSYVPCAIVLGDVGAREALGRSVRLARARWRLALVVALFPAVFSSVQVLALGAGGDVVARFAEAANLGFDSGAARSGVTILVILATVAAIGSLVFTMTAVLAAPQIVAFVGLTHYAAGLDKARLPDGTPGSPPLPPPTDPAQGPGPGSSWTLPSPVQRFRWVSVAMLAAVVGMSILAALGLFLVARLQAG